MTHSGAIVIAVAGLALGCTSPSPPPPETPVVPVAGEARPPRTRPTSSSSNLTCRFVADDWSEEWNARLMLRLAPDSPPFAYVSRAALTVKVVRKEQLLVQATAESEGLVVNGAVANSELSLYPQRAVTLAGILIPGPDRILRLGAKGTPKELGVRVEYDADEFLEHPVACSELGLTPGEFDPMEGLVDDGAETVPIVVDELAVSSTPTGVPRARLDTAVAMEAFVVERSGARVRIVWQRGADVIVGWVDASDINQHHGQLIGVPFATGGLGLRGVGAGTATVCDQELRLYAEVAGERREVGVVRPGAKLDLLEALDDYTVIAGRTSGIHAAEGAKLSVDNDALSTCRQR